MRTSPFMQGTDHSGTTAPGGGKFVCAPLHAVEYPRRGVVNPRSLAWMIVTHPLKNSRIPRLPCMSVHTETVADHLPRKRLLTGGTRQSNCGEKYPVGVGRGLMLAPRAVPKRRVHGWRHSRILVRDLSAHTGWARSSAQLVVIGREGARRAYR